MSQPLRPPRKMVKIGLNYFRDIVLFCVDCQTTFAKNVQDKTMVEIDQIIADHTHTQQNLDFVADLRKHHLNLEKIDGTD